MATNSPHIIRDYVPSSNSLPPPTQHHHLYIANLHALTQTAMARAHVANILKQLRAAFTRFDADADGSLTHHDLAALLRCVGLRPTHAQVRALLSTVDSNGNGAVEFAELAAAVIPVVVERMLLDRERLMGLFRSFDRDGNGYITAAELALSMARMGQPLTFRELAEMMREADTDGDGVISFSEFASIMGKVGH